MHYYYGLTPMKLLTVQLPCLDDDHNGLIPLLYMAVVYIIDTKLRFDTRL